MFTEQHIRETSSHGARVMALVMFSAVGADFLYLALMGSCRESMTSFAGDRFGETARDLTPIALILPAFAIFLIPSLIAAHYTSGRFKIVCPSCAEDASSRSRWILATRCCPACGGRIVEGGRTHAAAVYRRSRAIAARSFLEYWFWAWPVLGSVVMIWRLIDDTAIQECPQWLWLPPLIGASTAGWTWFRTFDRRYLPQLVSSVVLLVAVAGMFWQGL